MLIVFEGLDRSGKTTQANLVQIALSNRYPQIQVCRRRYPSRDGPLGKVINEHLVQLETLNQRAFQLLCVADRWTYNDEIRKELEDGNIVILDRYIHSGLAYSGALGMDLHWCVGGNVGLVNPDVIVYFELDEATQRQRMYDGDECYENLKFQGKVRDIYESIISSIEASGESHVIRVNAGESMSSITNSILEKLPAVNTPYKAKTYLGFDV